MVTAGNPLTDPIVLNEEDQYNNIETGDNSTMVTASLNSGAGTLLGPATVTVVQGVASFNYLEDNKAGTLSLQFMGGDLPPVIAPPTIVTPAPARELDIAVRPPGSVVAGNSFTMTVNAYDPYGNLATSFAGPVTAGLATGTLSGMTTVMANSGVAAFNDLVATKSGPTTLSVGSGTLAGVTASGPTVSPAAATQLVVTTPPPNPVIPGQPFTLGVSAEDAYGNVVPNYNGNVTIALPNGTTTTMQAQNGVATFAGLTEDTSAQGATIQATASGLTAVTSNPIVVAPAPTITAKVAMTQQYNKKHKPVGKPKFGGFEFDFSTAMNPASINKGTNYTLDTYVSITKKVGKKRVKMLELQKIGFSLSSYNPANKSVDLVPAGNQTFAKGGQITISGVASEAGVLLKGSDVFNIQAKTKKITAAN